MEGGSPRGTELGASEIWGYREGIQRQGVQIWTSDGGGVRRGAVVGVWRDRGVEMKVRRDGGAEAEGRAMGVSEMVGSEGWGTDVGVRRMGVQRDQGAEMGSRKMGVKEAGDERHRGVHGVR